MIKRLKGFTLIELLIVVAIIAILAAIAVPNFLEAQTRSKVARVRSDMRSLATALESYYVDNNSYPAQDSSNLQGGGNQGLGANNLPNATPALLNQPTFRRKRDAADPVATLTTPVAYITSYFTDPFAATKGATFSYSRTHTSFPMSTMWIVWSPGPDNDEASGTNIKATPGTSNIPYVDTQYLNPNVRNPTQSLIFVTYDPTNGTNSTGDVYRIKE